jgi:hypothetical protein
MCIDIATHVENVGFILIKNIYFGLPDFVVCTYLKRLSLLLLVLLDAFSCVKNGSFIFKCIRARLLINASIHRTLSDFLLILVIV